MTTDYMHIKRRRWQGRKVLYLLNTITRNNTKEKTSHRNLTAVAVTACSGINSGSSSGSSMQRQQQILNCSRSSSGSNDRQQHLKAAVTAAVAAAVVNAVADAAQQQILNITGSGSSTQRTHEPTSHCATIPPAIRPVHTTNLDCTNYKRSRSSSGSSIQQWQ
jgi:hypothetical protein